MNKSAEPQTTSETTGLRSLGQTVERSIGELRGAAGSVVPLTTAEPVLPPAIAEAAQRADPRAVDDSLLASWPRSVQRLATWTTTADFERMGLKFANLEMVPLPDLQAALALTVRCMRPAPPSFIVQEFTKCALATKTRAEDVADIKARSLVFVEDLVEFPADVITEAFKFWRRTETFSPAVANIRERCWRLAGARVSAKRAFESELKRRSA